MSQLKAFISYRHTGEKAEDIEQLLAVVRDGLERAGVKPRSVFFDDAELGAGKLGAAQIMAQAFAAIDQSDILFVVQASQHKSEGMLMEVGYCKAKGIPIIVAVRTGIEDTYLPDMGHVTFEWADLAELSRRMQLVDFVALA